MLAKAIASLLDIGENQLKSVLKTFNCKKTIQAFFTYYDSKDIDGERQIW